MTTLREQLLSELDRESRGYPTWWAKFTIDCTTADARAEFKRMEAEGIVQRLPDSTPNNILWKRKP